MSKLVKSRKKFRFNPIVFNNIPNTDLTHYSGENISLIRDIEIYLQRIPMSSRWHPLSTLLPPHVTNKEQILMIFDLLQTKATEGPFIQKFPMVQSK